MLTTYDCLLPNISLPPHNIAIKNRNRKKRESLCLCITEGLQLFAHTFRCLNIFLGFPSHIFCSVKKIIKQSTNFVNHFTVFPSPMYDLIVVSLAAAVEALNIFQFIKFNLSDSDCCPI